ncbi:uncharacterized protein LOC144143104 [Haemaphysalis longicornis]
MTPDDRQRLHERAEAITAGLSSVSGTERKLRTLRSSDNTEPSASAPTYTIVDLSAINKLLEKTVCRVCKGDVSIEKSPREYGVAVELRLCCSVCGDVDREWSSQRVEGSAKCTPFEINILAARAVQATGNGQTALNDLFSTMGISHRGLHNKTYQVHLKQKLKPAATQAAEGVMKNCASAVKELYKELDFGNPGNIAICFDGTWMTRGHQSHIGVGTVIELFSGYVLDFTVLSNYCAGCKNAPPEDDPDYSAWQANHVCQKNTDSKAGQMEVEAALILFQRSLERYGLRYTVMLCDGDSKHYNAVEKAQVYGFILVQKEDCINHVKKRMNSQLRNLLKQKANGAASLGGRGRLTADLITKLSNYYGRALKANVGNVDQMHDAVMATYNHVTSTDERPNHGLCPSGPGSWCKHNAAIANVEKPPKHSYNLPEHVSKALLPVYTRLADKELLRRCQRGKTQNANEALHSVIWSLMPKTRHASLIAVEAAVAEAVMRFNAGTLEASSRILRELRLPQNCKDSQRAQEKDSQRAASSERKRAASASFVSAARRRHRGKPDENYSPGAF